MKFPGHSLVRVLGKGRFCTAFESDASNVVKVFQMSDENVAKNEIAMLQRLAEVSVANVPQFKASENSMCGSFIALVVSPVGKAVLPIRGGCRTVGKDWASIVSTLQHAHSCGIAHRDVKPSNIFMADSGIILNDWGSSCEMGERIRWVGTRGYSEEADENGFHTPSAVCDLKALLRSVYSMMTQEVPPCGGDDSAVRAFWVERLRESTYWHDCLTAVNCADYSRLIVCFNCLK